MAAKLSCTLVDSMGRVTSRQYEMDAQTLLADYVTAATGFITALEDVTDLGLLKASLQIDLTGVAFDAIANSNVDVGAKAVGVLDTDPARKASVAIPGIKDTLHASDGTVPISGVTATWLGAFEATGAFTVAHGIKVDSWVKAAMDK